jgi:hypothetical protein
LLKWDFIITCYQTAKNDYVDSNVYRPRIELSEVWKAKGERIQKILPHPWVEEEVVS